MLLDQGSSPVIRKVAADQVGEILDTQPAELQNLLNKVCRCWTILMFIQTLQSVSSVTSEFNLKI